MTDQEARAERCEARDTVGRCVLPRGHQQQHDHGEDLERWAAPTPPDQGRGDDLNPKQSGDLDPFDHLDLADLREQNLARARRWHGPDSEPWSLADWSNAMCGEAGEAANVVKKIRRHETSIGSSYNTPDLDALGLALARELADVVIYADLLAAFAGIDLGWAIRRKFNEVSRAQNFPERI